MLFAPTALLAFLSPASQHLDFYYILSLISQTWSSTCNLKENKTSLDLTSYIPLAMTFNCLLFPISFHYQLFKRMCVCVCVCVYTISTFSPSIWFFILAILGFCLQGYQLVTCFLSCCQIFYIIEQYFLPVEIKRMFCGYIFSGSKIQVMTICNYFNFNLFFLITTISFWVPILLGSKTKDNGINSN